MGRPRDAGREAEILGVAYEVLVERGYEGITFEEVARRAKASKPTLYRRWKSKRDLVVAALQAGPASTEEPGVVDTGSLRGDLLALARRLRATMHATDGYSALALLQAGFEDRELGDAIEHSMGPTGGRLPAAVIDAAVRRGELPEGADPFPYEEVTGSVLLLRRLNDLDTGDAYLEALVDTVLLPALRASATAAEQPLPAGVFSNRAAPVAAAPDSEGNSPA